MGCFLACFGGDKERRRRKPAGWSPSREGVAERCRRMQPGSPSPLKQLRSPPRKPLQPSSPTERTQQLGIETLHLTEGPQPHQEEAVAPGSHLELSTKDEWRSALRQIPEEEEEEKASRPLLELRDKAEKRSFSSPRKRVTFDPNVTTYGQAPNDEIYSSQEIEGEEKDSKDEKPPSKEGNLTPFDLGAFTLNHRYQNCMFSDDDVEEDDEDNYDYIDDDGDEDVDDEDFKDCVFGDNKDAMDGKGNEEEESYDSYFSLPLEREKQAFEVNSAAKLITCSSPDGQPGVMAGQAARDRTHYVHPVLNPVENLFQWKEVKGKARSSKHPRKENRDAEQGTEVPFSFQPSFKLPNYQKAADVINPSLNTHSKKEISVDASLSNWLPSSEISPVEGSQGNSSSRTKSSVSLDDRPILGALTMEDLIQHSISSSTPRKSPSRSPDEIPILGTVGSYWSCTNGDTNSGFSQKSASDTKGIPNTTRKYREDRRVNWHSTPFQVRLERALNSGDAEAYCTYPPGAC